MCGEVFATLSQQIIYFNFWDFPKPRLEPLTIITLDLLWKIENVMIALFLWMRKFKDEIFHTSYTWCGLIVRVPVLHLKRSNDSPSKARVVYVILLITITWRGIDEPTLDPFFYLAKKKKKKFTPANCFLWNIM